LSVVLEEVAAMSKATVDLHNDPVCGFCVVRLQIRPRLRRTSSGAWRCPVCRAVTVHPTDPDATARDLEVVFVEGAASTLRRQQEAMNEWLAKPRIVEPGAYQIKGSKLPRKRKKPSERYRWYRAFGEV